MDRHADDEKSRESDCDFKPKTNINTYSSCSNEPYSNGDNPGTKYGSSYLNTRVKANQYAASDTNPSDSYGTETGNQHSSTQSITSPDRKTQSESYPRARQSTHCSPDTIVHFSCHTGGTIYARSTCWHTKPALTTHT